MSKFTASSSSSAEVDNGPKPDGTNVRDLFTDQPDDCVVIHLPGTDPASFKQVRDGMIALPLPTRDANETYAWLKNHEVYKHYMDEASPPSSGSTSPVQHPSKSTPEELAQQDAEEDALFDSVCKEFGYTNRPSCYSSLLKLRTQRNQALAKKTLSISKRNKASSSEEGSKPKRRMTHAFTFSERSASKMHNSSPEASGSSEGFSQEFILHSAEPQDSSCYGIQDCDTISPTLKKPDQEQSV